MIEGVVDAYPYYVDPSNGSMWLLDAETLALRPISGNAAQLTWESTDCTGPAYVVGNGVIPLPRITFTMPGVAGVHVRRDDAVRLTVAACSYDDTGTGCFPSLPCPSPNPGVPRAMVDTVAVPTVLASPPLHRVVTP